MTIVVTVRYFAAAQAAARTESETLDLPAGTTVAGLIGRLRERGPDLAKVLDRCAYLCDEIAVRDQSAMLQTSQTIDVLPPFAGG